MKNIYWVLVDKNKNIDHAIGGQPLIYSMKKHAMLEKKEGGKYYRNIYPAKCEIKIL